MNPKYYALMGRVFSYAAQFLIIILLPLILSPELFAKYNLVMPILMLGSSVLYGWLNGAAFRWSHKIVSSSSSTLGGSIAQYYLVLLLVSLLIAAGLLLAGRTYESLIPLAIFIISIKDYFSKLSNACEDYRKFAYANSLLFIGKIAFIIALQLLRISNFELILILFIVSELFFLPPFFNKAWRPQKIEPQVTLATLKSMMGYGGPLITASIAVWIVSLSDRYILSIFADKTAVANYILVYQFAANAITIPLMFFITVFFPTLIRMERESGLETALQYNKKMLKKYYTFAPLYALSVGIALYIVLKMFYQKYQTDAWLIAIVMIAQLLCGASHFYNKKYELDNRTHLLATAVFISAFIDVISNFLLIPRFGAIGAACSALIAYGVLILVTANMDTLLSKNNKKLAAKTS